MIYIVSSVSSVYGVVSAMVFKKKFFPTGISPEEKERLVWMIYALGYVTRPIGGLIFGHFGDKVRGETRKTKTRGNGKEEFSGKSTDQQPQEEEEEKGSRGGGGGSPGGVKQGTRRLERGEMREKGKHSDRW
jgi:MFS family permease